MDAITHVLVGRLLAQGLGPDAVGLGWLATLFAILPDFDTVSWAFPKLRRYVQHRGITHTLPFGVGASAVAGLVFALAGWAPFLVAFAVALVAFLSHVGLDVLNWGAPVLWPWHRRRVEWTLHAGFTWSAGLSAGSLVFLTALGQWAPHLERSAGAVLAAAFATYLAFRALLKVRAQRRSGGRRALPTGNPFVWIIASEAAR